MPHVRQHWYCPEAQPRRIISRQGVRFYPPMGEVKTLYYRKGGRWIRAGLLCLNGLLFIPAPKFIRPTPTFPCNRKVLDIIDDGKKD
ncbi:MAG: hypothetical protein ACYDHZ_01100 [Dehalococcoidia bacterium]